MQVYINHIVSYLYVNVYLTIIKGLIHNTLQPLIFPFFAEKMYTYPVMFAPVHNLSKQIQVLNAYVREAEYLGDALHGTMLDLLDEIIEVHSHMCQKSLFAGMQDISIFHYSLFRIVGPGWLNELDTSWII